ncbi:unnamed protein product [Symbiodinium necroappetens]|uniref:Uncharacterized protein n=1 Tax=Symbiodinium necroappetens TaxID=1628268 RepID=A0A813CM06_9DINO|nr:unnamed protein product [Symbiodinium necroappetens]
MAWSRARPACPAWCAVAVLAVILYRAIDGCTEVFLSPPRQKAVNGAAGASGALLGLGAAAPAAHAFEMPNLGQFFSTVWRVVSTGSDEVYDPTTEEGAKALGLAVPLPKDGFGEVTQDDVLPFALFLLALVAWGLLVVPSNMDRSDGAKSVLFPSQVPKLQESSVFGLQLLASSSPPPVPVFFGQRQWSCPMILYDNKSILSLSCKYHGSVFPKATLIALPFVIAVIVLKALVQAEQISLDDLDLITDGSVYGAFSLVLSFTLVFRCQQAYQRYIESAKAMHTMSAEWIDACGSLLSFSKASHRSDREKAQFEGVMVRLFCLMHACAMEDLCNKGDHFKLLDIEVFLPEDLKLLEQPDGANTLENPISMQIQYVFIWIKYLIVQGIQSGLLDVPPPILTRAYQEIGAGMAQFHNAQMISMWPFPFPYAQLSLFLSVLHLFLSPIIMLKYTSSVWASALLTYISIVCVMSLNIIGVELENPFGEDTNDLPAAETHEQFRHHILLLADPGAWQVPRTKDSFSTGFEQLRNASGRRVSLKQHLNSTAHLDSDLAKDMKATDTAGEANGPGPQNPQTSPKSHGHDPGHGQSPHGGQHFAADPKQVEILERWLSRQSSMLESFLTKQQALMEQMLRFRNVEVKASNGPSVFTPEGCCSISAMRPRPLV